ncbi:MAG: hypothetical protein ABJD97_02200 [Betaproteobacteria bacterium]
MSMTFARTLHHVAALAGCTALVACGGGGGSNSSGVDGTPPASGPYAWVLKAQGPTTSLTYGLSLLHAATPHTEYVVEFGSSVLTDTRVVSSGSVDAAGMKTGTLQPYALLYIVGGDVRRVSLLANGSLPSTQVQRGHSTTACKFLANAEQQSIGDAVDFATPENSRFQVSTAGPDGQRGTGDDGSAEVRLSATTGIVVTANTGAAPLGAFRGATTLAPRGWILPRSVVYWGASGAADTTATTRAAGDPAFVSAVQATPTTALMDDATQLSVLDMTTGSAPVESKLDAATTGGGGWVGIGFDATAFFAYRNAGSGAAARWSIVKVTRTSPHATVLGSGNGVVSVASMGSTLLYATVLGASDNRLLAVSKSIGVPVTTLETSPLSTLTTVQTSANGIHELWRVVNIDTAALNYAIEFIDESGALLYSTSAGGYPMAAPDATVQRFDTSESRTRFVFANGYGSRAFGDATLMGYDTAAKATRTFGALPGSVAFGVDTVDANTIGGPGGLMAGFAARSVDGVIASTGTQVFSFDFDSASSLAFTNVTR